MRHVNVKVYLELQQPSDSPEESQHTLKGVGVPLTELSLWLQDFLYSKQ